MLKYSARSSRRAVRPSVIAWQPPVSKGCAPGERGEGTHVDDLRARKPALRNAGLGVDRELDERAERGRGLELEPPEVAELAQAELVEQLLAVRQGASVGERRGRRKGGGVRDGAVVDEVELGVVLEQGEAALEVDGADVHAATQNLG